MYFFSFIKILFDFLKMVEYTEFTIRRVDMDIRTDRLRKAFQNSGLSQTEVCEKAGINKGAFSSYLSGRYFPKQQALEKLSIALNVSISYLMGLDAEDSDHLPANAILPSARSLPIIGTICAGDGRLCFDDNLGRFIIDLDVRADYCLRVSGDSMIDADIFDGDIVFILKDCDFVTGQIYAVEFKDSRDAVLKKVEQDGENIILIPCNPAYHTMVTDYEEIRIVGRCVGVYHSYF